MKTVEEYLRHAGECEALANGSTSPEEREMINDMARTWRMLADRRKKMLAMRETHMAPRLKSKKNKVE